MEGFVQLYGLRSGVLAVSVLYALTDSFEFLVLRDNSVDRGLECFGLFPHLD